MELHTLHRRDYPILGFLEECKKVDLEKKILDCGAGGPTPPLAVFNAAGYKTYGIEILEGRIEQSNKYAKEHNMELNIILGDMRELPYESESFSFVFSHHTIHHMTKNDIRKAMKEMERVLKPGGLLFVNFPSVDCVSFDKNIDTTNGELVQIHGGQEVIHCFYQDDEADAYFENYIIQSKNKWKLFVNEGWSNGMSMIEYTARKK